MNRNINVEERSIVEREIELKGTRTMDSRKKKLICEGHQRINLNLMNENDS